MKLNKIDEVWSCANSPFKWRFRFVVIQKFCYHGNMTSRLLLSIINTIAISIRFTMITLIILIIIFTMIILIIIITRAERQEKDSRPKVASECPEKREELVQDISRLLRVLRFFLYFTRGRNNSYFWRAWGLNRLTCYPSDQSLGISRLRHCGPR